MSWSNERVFLFRPDSIPTNLVAYWKFNGSNFASNGLEDSSPNGTHTLTAGATTQKPISVQTDYWKTGEYSASFADATDNYFSVNNTDNILDLTGSFSISFWMITGDASSTAIIDKGGITGAANGWMVAFGSATFAVLVGGVEKLTNSGWAASNRWYHMTVTLDTDTDILSLYIDGNLVQTAACNTTNTSNEEALNIGIRSDGATTRAFTGTLKDMAIWTRALNPLEIKSLALGVDLSKYAYRPNHVSTQPTHWYKMNEVSGVRYDAMTGADALNLTDTGTVASGGGYLEGIGAAFSADYFTAADDADWSWGTGDFTIATWLKPTTGSANTYLLDYGANSGWYVEKVNADSIKVALEGNSYTFDTFNPDFANATWYHLVIRRASGSLTVWCDGIQQDDAKTATDNVSYTGGALYVGASSTPSFQFTGGMQDLAFWKGYALSDAEISSLACGLPIQRQGIVSYWKMEGATAGNETDSIGSNTLTFVGDAGELVTATGQVSKGRDFERGESAYLAITHAAQSGLDITTDITLMCWFKREEAGQTHQLLNKGQGGATGYGMNLGADNVMHARLGATVQFDGTTSVAATGVWRHIVAMHTGATRNSYINAVADYSGADTALPASIAEDFRIGVNTAPAGYADGILDEAVVAKRYFRPEEIKAAYVKGLNGKEVTTMEVRPASGFLPMFI